MIRRMSCLTPGGPIEATFEFDVVDATTLELRRVRTNVSASQSVRATAWVEGYPTWEGELSRTMNVPRGVLLETREEDEEGETSTRIVTPYRVGLKN